MALRLCVLSKFFDVYFMFDYYAQSLSLLLNSWSIRHVGEHRPIHP